MAEIENIQSEWTRRKARAKLIKDYTEQMVRLESKPGNSYDEITLLPGFRIQGSIGDLRRIQKRIGLAMAPIPKLGRRTPESLKKLMHAVRDREKRLGLKQDYELNDLWITTNRHTLIAAPTYPTVKTQRAPSTISSFVSRYFSAPKGVHTASVATLLTQLNLFRPLAELGSDGAILTTSRIGISLGTDVPSFLMRIGSRPDLEAWFGHYQSCPTTLVSYNDFRKVLLGLRGIGVTKVSLGKYQQCLAVLAGDIVAYLGHSIVAVPDTHSDWVDDALHKTWERKIKGEKNKPPLFRRTKV